MRGSEDVLDVFWTSYTRPIYVLCLLGYRKKCISFLYITFSLLITAYCSWRWLILEVETPDIGIYIYTINQRVLRLMMTETLLDFWCMVVVTFWFTVLLCYMLYNNFYRKIKRKGKHNSCEFYISWKLRSGLSLCSY